eukprot:3869558-Rhodomonas_salina.2
MEEEGEGDVCARVRLCGREEAGERGPVDNGGEGVGLLGLQRQPKLKLLVVHLCPPPTTHPLHHSSRALRAGVRSERERGEDEADGGRMRRQDEEGRKGEGGQD